MDLREKVAHLPLEPGVYLYKDAHGKVIYVGKAKSLRARVRSYFAVDRPEDAKTDTLLSEAREVDYILVDNEKEALAREQSHQAALQHPAARRQDLSVHQADQ